MTVAARPKPRRLTVDADLEGLLTVKLGRKSTPDPRNPGKSVGDQLDGVDRNCARRGLIEYARIEEDRQGASQYSKKTTRVKFEEAMKIIETREIAVFAVWSLSRSTRRLMVHGSMVELLERRNTLILVGDRLYDCSDPADKMSLGFQALMDDNQVAVSRIDTLRGLAAAARLGRPHGPHVYGYQRIYDEKTRALIRVDVVDAEANIIRECLERVIDAGDSCREIARSLTERGVARPRGAKAWYPQEVKDLLLSVIYTGKRSHTLFRTEDTTLYEAMWDAIITPEEQEDARAVLEGRSNHASYRREAKYMLTGIVKCGRCEDPQPMYGNRQGGLRRQPPEGFPMVYHCPACRMSRSMAKVDQVVRDVVNAWMSDPRIVARYAKASTIANPEVIKDREALAKAQADLEEAYEAGLSPRGLAVQERRLLPLIQQLEDRLRIATSGEKSGWATLGSEVAHVPDDTNEARLLLRRLVAVRILPAGRGVRFRPEQVSISPLLSS